MSEFNVEQGGNLLEPCQAWQRLISESDDLEYKTALASQAVQTELSGLPGHYGARKVIVKAGSALMMPDGLSAEEALWPMLAFGEVVLKGDLGRVTYLRMRQQGLITWMLHNSRVINTQEATAEELSKGFEEREFDYYLPVERAIKRPLYLPVGMIDYALAAA